MKSLLLILSVFFCLSLPAQHKLVFTKAGSSKTITVNQKDLVRLSFNGYLNQPQMADGVTTEITDSSITLTPRKKLFQKIRSKQTIILRDITGFKRFSKFRPAGEIIYGIMSVGATATVTAIIAGANIPTAAGFLVTAATSTVTLAVKNVFLPTKIKNYLNKGWGMKILPAQ
jgi:peptidoglycan hydrolase-like protein with peptidoglycan-binding domain